MIGNENQEVGAEIVKDVKDHVIEMIDIEVIGIEVIEIEVTEIKMIEKEMIEIEVIEIDGIETEIVIEEIVIEIVTEIVIEKEVEAEIDTGALETIDVADHAIENHQIEDQEVGTRLRLIAILTASLRTLVKVHPGTKTIQITKRRPLVKDLQKRRTKQQYR